MLEQSRRLKGWAIAIVVLALSAGAAFGADGLPTAATQGLDRAATASGNDVPMGQVDRDAEIDEDDGGTVEESPVEESEETVEETEEDAEESEEAEETDEVTTDEDEAWDNHGELVSTAAHMDTPEGFRNHGHFVSCVARMPFDPEAEPLDLATLTPDDCDGVEDEEAAEEEEVVEEEVVEEEVVEEDAEAWDNHGAMVSEAARMETPEGFRNHGHWVSCVAHMDSSVWVDLTTLTVDDCDGEAETDESAEADDGEETVEPAGKADRPDQAKGKGHGKEKVRGGHGRGRGRNG